MSINERPAELLHSDPVLRLASLSPPSHSGISVAKIFAVVEFLVTLVFLAEYCLCYYAAPLDPKHAAQGYKSHTAARKDYVFSLQPMINLLAIVPYFLALAGIHWADRYDGELRMLRISRLLILDKFTPAVSLIGKVITKNRLPLCGAGFAAACVWMFTAALLYVTEFRDPAVLPAGRIRGVNKHVI